MATYGHWEQEFMKLLNESNDILQLAAKKVVKPIDDEPGQLWITYFNEESELKLTELMMSDVIENPDEAFRQWFWETFNSGPFYPDDDLDARSSAFSDWFSVIYHRILSTITSGDPVVAQYAPENILKNKTSNTQTHLQSLLEE
jgi:hypothetical protein